MSKFFPDPSPSFHAPALYTRLGDNGQLEEMPFDCKFKRKTQTELKALDEMVKAWRGKGQDVDKKILEEVCLGWRIQLPKEEGQKETVKAIDFSMATAEAMEETHPGFIGACIRSFYVSATPTKAAHLAEKN